MTINERISVIQKDSGMTVNMFAQAIGISQPSAKAIIDGKNAPSYKAIEGIVIGFPNISLEWLFRENGSMYLQDHSFLSSRLDAALNEPISLEMENIKAYIDQRIEQVINEKLKKV